MGAVATSDVKRVLRPLGLAGKHATMYMLAGRIARYWSGRKSRTMRETGRQRPGDRGDGDALAAEGRGGASAPGAALLRCGGGARQGGCALAHRTHGAARHPVRSADGGGTGGGPRATWDECDFEAAVWTVAAGAHEALPAVSRAICPTVPGDAGTQRLRRLARRTHDVWRSSASRNRATSDGECVNQRLSPVCAPCYSACGPDRRACAY